MTRLSIGIVSKLEHAQRTKQALEMLGHSVTLIKSDPGTTIPMSLDVIVLRTQSSSHDMDARVRAIERDADDPRIVIHANSVTEAKRKVAAIVGDTAPEEKEEEPMLQCNSATDSVRDVLKYVGILWSRAGNMAGPDFLAIAREIGFGHANYDMARASVDNLWSFSGSVGRAFRHIRDQNVDQDGYVTDTVAYHETCFGAVPTGKGRRFPIVVLSTRELTEAERDHLMTQLQAAENYNNSQVTLHGDVEGVNMTNESRQPMHSECGGYAAYFHSTRKEWNVRNKGGGKAVPGYTCLPNRAAVKRAFEQLSSAPTPAPEPKRRPAPPKVVPVPARAVGERSPTAEADAMVRVGILYAELRTAMREAAILEFEGADGGVVVIPALTHFRFRSMHGCSVAGDEGSTVTRAASEVTCPSCIETLTEIGLWS